MPIPQLPTLCIFLTPVALAGCTGATIVDDVTDYARSSIMRDGKVIGSKERFVREIDDGRQVVTRQSMKVVVIGTPPRDLIEERMMTQDRDGNVVSIQHRSLVGPYETTTAASISELTAVVTRETSHDVRKTTVALPNSIRFDNGAALLAQWDPVITPQLEFHALDVRAPLIERVVYKFDNSSGSSDARTLVRLTYVDENLRSLTRLSLDDQGGPIKADQPMLGATIRVDTTDSGTVGSSNPVRESLIKSPYRIPREAMSGHIRYTFGFDVAVEFTPPQTGEQQVTALPDGFILDICDGCGPGLDEDEVTLTEALQPTFWLQSDHEILTGLVQSIRNSDSTDAERMTRLTRMARRRMPDIDFSGHFSAAEALARRSGDCTESAVVLAALGRAAGIPTKVASGIVYSRERYHGVSHAFMPHAWALAYVDGEWKSFDAALDDFDATHIALTISNGDPGSIQAGHHLAALLTWDAMTAVEKK